MTVMSGLTKMPPLKPAIGVRSASGSINIAMPRGGRPLVIAKAIPAAASAFTAAAAREVSTLSVVTKRAINIGQHKRNFRGGEIWPYHARPAARADRNLLRSNDRRRG